ncbi:MAG: UDP-2,4-diacetamido-2,4,6-trideoxy-beta-L-altropyranose hydrolase, partial [Bacteroidota bacterium]
MNIIIRTDASVEIGTGHVMRCLTLADALRSKGAIISFICMELYGSLCDFLAARGYVV